MRGSAVARIALAFVTVIAFFAAPSPPASAGGAVRAPVIDADLPDPAIVWTGSAWYVFGTNTVRGSRGFNVPAVSSFDLVHFSPPFDAMPTLGSWAVAGFTWAPAPVLIGSTWVLYYTAHDRTSDRQCIGSATSSTVTGPYVDDAASALVCQGAHGGSIDPSSFVSTDGQRWLVWKSDDNAIGESSALWSAKLATSGRSLTTAPSLLLQADTDWEASIIEAPYMVQRNNQILLFYSGNWFASDSYAEGYAICSSAAGPCTNQTVSSPWMATATTGAVGPGGASFVTFGSHAVMAFHSWRTAIGPDGYRAVSIEPVDLTSLPDWRPAWTRGLPSARLLDATTGDYVLGRYGDVHPYRGPDNVTGSMWTGWQIVRGGALDSGGTKGLTLDAWGGLHSLTIGSATTAIGGGASYWPGSDVARDVAVTGWSPARGFVLDAWGGLHPFGGAGDPQGVSYWPGYDIARRAVMLPSGTGGYVLDGWGGIHPFSIGATPSPPPASSASYWPGQDVATAFVVNPSGTGGYVLDSWGGVHPFALGGAQAPPGPAALSYYVANGSAVDLVVTDWSVPSGYTLDSVGNRHPFGAAAPATSGASASSAPAPASGEVLRGCRSVDGTVRCTYATPYGGFVER